MGCEGLPHVFHSGGLKDRRRMPTLTGWAAQHVQHDSTRGTGPMHAATTARQGECTSQPGECTSVVMRMPLVSVTKDGTQ